MQIINCRNEAFFISVLDWRQCFAVFFEVYEAKEATALSKYQCFSSFHNFSQSPGVGT